MILKRHMTKHILVALPALALGLTACSADDPEPKPQNPAKQQAGSIALTIPLSATRSADDGFALNSNQRKSLFIATYDKEGNLIETIVKDGEIDGSKAGYDANFDKIEEIGNFGTVLSVVLPAEKYADKSGVQVAAVYLPTMVQNGEAAIADFSAPATLSDLYQSAKNAYTLDMPVENGVWTPVNDSEMNIPMAGILDITSAMSNYDPALWSKENPMFLNNDPLQLERAMAKVVITEGKGVGYFSSVGFDTPHHGTIMPKVDEVVWPNFGHVTQATPFLDFNSCEEHDKLNFTQTYTPDPKENEFVFYTFETTFEGEDAQTRELIHIEWKNKTSADHDPVARSFKFQYYPKMENGVDKTANSEFGPNSNVWKGILRNHEYHFTIGLPQEQSPTIELKVNEWTPERYSVEL